VGITCGHPVRTKNLIGVEFREVVNDVQNRLSAFKFTEGNRYFRPAHNYCGAQGAGGKKRFLRTGSGKRQLRAWGFSAEVKLTPSVVRGSTQH